MKALERFLLLPACACLGLVHAGCNVTMTMPQVRYHTPEVRNEAGRGHALFTAQQATEIVLVPSTLATPPITDAPEFAADLRDVPGFTAALSASNRVELSVRATDDAPMLFAAKYQVAGVSTSGARANRFCCALLAGGGGGRSTGTDENSSTGFVAERELENYAVEGGVLAGRRFGSILPYGGVYYARYWAEGSVKQGGDRFEFDGDGGQLGLNAGLAATVWHVEARAELSRSFSDWESEEAEETALGVALGATW